MTYTDDKFVQDLRDTLETTWALIRSREQMTRDQMTAHIKFARISTDDSMTDLVAVNLCCSLVAALGILPSPELVHSFAVHTGMTSAPIDPEDAPAGLTTRSRIVVALANADPGAARDVWTAFRDAHPDQITDFIADTIDTVHEVATRRGVPLGGLR